MEFNPQYMQRCLQLAVKGRGYTSPNPMVGAVVVYKGKIIGEGYHRKYGGPHAEVNAINSVFDKQLLKDSTLYVSLEPCSHYGKTPPCSQLIIDSGIPRVVIGSLDPFPKVSGRGVKMLLDAGVKVEVGVLGDECDELNKEFITAYTKNRPYIYLKWAQTRDGYMDKIRLSSQEKPVVISNDFTSMQVHQLRAQVDAIMVGTNTAILDNPALTTRLWYGNNPTRIVLDRELKVPATSTIFDGQALTYIITEKKVVENNLKNVEFIDIKYDDFFLSNLMIFLREREILSIMVEGGAKLLQCLLHDKMWDEAFVEVSDTDLGEGIKAPEVEGVLLEKCKWRFSEKKYFRASHA